MSAHTGHAEHEHEWRPSPNMPPFTIRDLVGILVAMLGTITLGLFA